MAVPKKRTSKQRKRKRRTHHEMPVANLGPCPNCGDPKLPHRVCPTCGMYKGEQVVDTDEL